MVDEASICRKMIINCFLAAGCFQGLSLISTGVLFDSVQHREGESVDRERQDSAAARDDTM